jgi:hypothetical protein
MKIALIIIAFIVLFVVLWLDIKTVGRPSPKFLVVDEQQRIVDPKTLIDEAWVEQSLAVTDPGDIWFVIDDQGGLYLMDSCGNYTHCPSKYRAIF